MSVIFKIGPQVKGTTVVDSSGVEWLVLKDIANAKAPPREGSYYTRVVVTGPTALELLEVRITSLESRLSKIENNSPVEEPEKPVEEPEILEPEKPEVIISVGTTLNDMFGVNTYAWNFTQDPNNANINDRIFEPKMNLINTFKGGIRHYIDRHLIEENQGVYTFQPAHRGSWHFDLIFERCHKDGLLNLVCLKEAQKYLYEQWPEPRDSRNPPATYGVDLENPLAYIDQAKLAFQVAARYGSNKNVPLNLMKVDTKQRWTGDEANEIKIGLGTVTHMESDNERDLWWLENKRGFQSGRQFAAQCSAFYDGHKGSLGLGVGAKSADPNMVIVLGGLATPSPEYVQEMIDWCKEKRGLKADGSIDLCFDVINYHQYASDGEDPGQWGYATRGQCPELTTLGQKAKDFVALGNKYKLDVWITETGYDVGPNTPQRAIPIGKKTAEDTQADWIVRTSLMYARNGVKRVFFYQLFDDAPLDSWVQYSSSGLAVCTTTETRKRPASLLIDKFTQELNGYAYSETLNLDPVVDVYKKGDQYAYVAYVPDEIGRTATYLLTKKDGTTVTLNLTETPIIIK